MERSRLDRVQVDITGELIELTWDERNRMLAKLPEPEPKANPQPTAERQRAAVKDWAAFVLSGVGR